jgi:predicted dehydrogenase
MNEKTIGLGVIGYGGMGRTMDIVRDVPGLRYEIRAICGVNQEKQRQLAEQNHIPFWTIDYRELVERKDVDVVVVFSPDHLHGLHSLAAVSAGKHVVCGKPNATTLDETRELARLVREKNVKYLATYTWRQDQQFLFTKKLLDDGDLGRIIALEGHYIHDMRDTYDRTPWRIDVPQDMMFGGCMHPIDILRAFAGDVEWVHAFANRGGLAENYPIPDNFYINLKFASGVIGRISGLYGVVHPPLPMNQFGVFASGGSVIAEYGPMQTRVVYEKLPGHKTMVTDFQPEPESRRFWYGPNMLRYMRHFQDCLDRDLEPNPGIVESAKSVAVGIAAWESIKTGQAVRVFNDF